MSFAIPAGIVSSRRACFWNHIYRRSGYYEDWLARPQIEVSRFSVGFLF